MTTNINNTMTVPSMESVELTHKQKFPSNGVSKNTITFDREEDMLVMCLSTFVHDYVHDYNLGSMHARVIKGNVLRSNPDEPSLFETLGITIGNTIFKIIAYYKGGHRDISMYNDEQFEDEPTRDTRKINFYNYLNEYEEPFAIVGGDIPDKSYDSVLNESVDELKLKKDELKVARDDVSEDELKLEKDELKVESEEDDYVKSVKYDDIKSILYIPSNVNSLNIERIIESMEKNADFLCFHSSLNTYIITYLGYDNNDNKEFVSTDNNKTVTMDKAIISSLNYIIDDMRSHDNININYFGDIFALMLDSYLYIKNKNVNANPLDILNSTELLYQFIIYFVSYITATDYNDYKRMVKSIEQIDTQIKTGGSEMEGTALEEPIGEDIELIDSAADSAQGSQSPLDSVQSSFSSNLLPEQPKEYIEVPEYVFITHNNLLTTITRGMFIKLGIWKKLFFPDRTGNDIDPKEYVFGFEQLNTISYDNLIKIFPIEPEKGGHRNNELLILEILILKRLLVEMSPSKTLTFGDKIDDDLKNYMDTFYHDYFSEKEKEIVEQRVEEEVIENPNFYGEDITNEDRLQMEKEAELIFDMCEEDCEYDADFSAGSNISMEGGMSFEDRMEMIQAKKELNPSETKLETKLETKSMSNIIEEQLIPAENTKDPEIDIIEQPKPPGLPILFNKLKKMNENNLSIIQQLKTSFIEPISVYGTDIDNLYDIMKLNETNMKRVGSKFRMPAPKYKFVINNAANIGSNINGSKLMFIRKFLESIKTTIDDIRNNVYSNNNLNNDKLTNYIAETKTKLDNAYEESKTKYDEDIRELNSKKRSKTMTIKEYNDLLLKKYEQKSFERTEIIPLKNKLFLLETAEKRNDFYEDFLKNYEIWFNNIQPIFGLYRNLQRGVFCPTTSMMDAMDNCSLKYNTTETKEVGTSYSEIKYSSGDKLISFGGVVLNYNQKVNGNKELTAKLYYELNSNVNGYDDIMTLSTLPIKVSESNDLKARVAYRGVVSRIKDIYDLVMPDAIKDGMDYLKQMWKNVQYQYDFQGYNILLSATALKTMGDYLQECQACFKWGGYIDRQDEFPTGIKNNQTFRKIKNKLIYRSVSKGGSIIPYDSNGNALRLGIQGDRPSGFRSIYLLMNGHGDINEHAITGYMFTSSTQNPSRSLLVAYDKGKLNTNNLRGKVIYVTKELQVPDKNALLRSLEYLNIKVKNRKVDDTIVVPEVTEDTIIGSSDTTNLLVNPFPKIQPFKNSAYDEMLSYLDTDFKPSAPKTETLNITIVDDSEIPKKSKSTTSSDKLAEKEMKKKEKLAEKESQKQQKLAEKEKIKEAKDIIKNKMKQNKVKKLTSTFMKTLNYDDLGIESNIFNKILNGIEEDERISLLAEEKVRKDREELERKKAERLAYESSPEGIAEKKAKEEELNKKRLEEEALLAKEQEEKEKQRQQEMEERQARIVQIKNDIERLNNELSGVEDKKQKISIAKQVTALNNELRRLQRYVGGSKSLKNNYRNILSITRKTNGSNVSNKLTKRQKRVKVRQNTRKHK